MATYYISPTGNDVTGTGTSGNPWQTISKAFTSSAAGDTIFCLPGTYTWVTQNFTTQRTIQCETAGGAIFDGAGVGRQWTWGAGLTLVNLRFQNSTMAVVQDSFFRPNNAVGATTLTLTSITFQTLTMYQEIVGVNGTPLTLVTTGCLFNDIARVVLGNYQRIFNLRGAVSASISNCTVYFATWTTSVLAAIFDTFGTTLTITMKNTILRNASGNVVTWMVNPGTVTYAVSYNCFNNITGAPTNSNGITSDPLFIDEVGGNFNLRQTSPCIDAGTLI